MTTTVADLIAADVLTMSDGYRTKRSEHASSGFRILRVADVLNDHVRLDGPDFVSSDFAKAIGVKAAQAGDVLLTTKGTVGRVAFMPSTDETVVYSPQLCFFRVRDASRLDPRWLSYWFRSGDFMRQASHRKDNTDMAAYINLADIRSLNFDLPSIHEQRGIAEVLGALDDKIAANTLLASLTDDLVRALFAQSTYRADTGTLADIATVNESSVKPGAGSLRYLDIASVNVGSYQSPPESPWAEAPGRARRKITSGDTVWSTVRPNRRSHALVLEDDPLLIGSTGLAVLTPKDGRFAFVYEASKSEAFTSYLVSVAEGSAYPAVRGDRFLEAPIPLPGVESMDRFESKAAPLRERAAMAQAESGALASMRDALLPLLMSGRLTVSAAESVVGEVL